MTLRYLGTLAALGLLFGLAACDKDKDVDPPAELVDVTRDGQGRASCGPRGSATKARSSTSRSVSRSTTARCTRRRATASSSRSTRRPAATAGAPTRSSPLAAGPGAGSGLVVVGTNDGEVVALDAAERRAGAGRCRSAARCWRHRSSPAIASSCARSTAGCARSNAADGKELWTVEEQVPRLSLRGTGPPVSAGETRALRLRHRQARCRIAGDGRDALADTGQHAARPHRARAAGRRRRARCRSLATTSTPSATRAGSPCSVSTPARSGGAATCRAIGRSRSTTTRSTSPTSDGSVLALRRRDGSAVWQQDGLHAAQAQSRRRRWTATVVGRRLRRLSALARSRDRHVRRARAARRTARSRHCSPATDGCSHSTRAASSSPTGIGGHSRAADVLPVIALVGRPNVGKSTLFNALTRTRDALVADVPGLTRDRKYGYAARWRTLRVVIDTGGLVEDAGRHRTADGRADAEGNRGSGPRAVRASTRAAVSRRRTCTSRPCCAAAASPCCSSSTRARASTSDIVTADFDRLGLGEPVSPCRRRTVPGLDALMSRALDGLATAATDAAGEPARRQDSRAIRVAVIGRPNVGKSTLINRLLGEERLITFDQPGTTRDSVFVPFERDGQHYVLIDTAGVRRRARVHDAVEKFSVVKTLQAIEQAHVVIGVLDAHDTVAEQDASLLGIVADAGSRAGRSRSTSGTASRRTSATQIRDGPRPAARFPVVCAGASSSRRGTAPASAS